MQSRRICFLVFLLFLKLNPTVSQVVLEPSYHTIYGFLSRLAQKGIIDVDDVIQPLTKDYIYSKLDDVSKKIAELTPLERQELGYYLKEYTLSWRNDPKSGFEGVYNSVLSSKIGDRFRIFAYQDKNFTLNVQPIIGFQSESRNGYSYFKNFKGFWSYGSINKNIGFSLDFRATSEDGRLEDYQRLFSSETGVIGIKPTFKTFDFNELNASVIGAWKWGKVMLGKSSIPIGYGMSGKIIMSEKAPSFPQIRLDVSPTKWLSFNYTHGWLNSLVIDSSSIYKTSIPNKFQYEYRNKYLAVHSVTFKPKKGISLLVGESAIYSDNIKIGYLIPVTIFSAMNHYLGELENNSVSNISIFSQISFRNLIKKTHLFATIFIDELRLKQSGNDSTSSRNHTAYQLGLSVTDLPIKNLFFLVEYTRIRPFTYIHFIPVQTYQNNGYNLGHWIGPNADQLYLLMQYRIRRGLDFKLIYQYIRKGTIGTGEQQATDNKYLYPFLWGDQTNYSMIQANLQYEVIHDLFIKLGYLHNDQYNTKSSLTNIQDQLVFGINFGF